MFRDKLFFLALACSTAVFSVGCSLIVPKKVDEPVIRNPFPQLSHVAVAPFFNQSDEPTLDGRKVAMAYFAELQSTPGFEVVPLGVVEEAIIAHKVDLSSPGEARRLATILGVDAVVVGAVTDYCEYYPPRLGLRVEWYTANPGYHPIPAGYGLPWDTPEEEYIPDSLVYESQLSRARTEMAGLAPDCDGVCQALPAPPASNPPSADGPSPLSSGTPSPTKPTAPAEITPPKSVTTDKQPADRSPQDAPADPAAKPLNPNLRPPPSANSRSSGLAADVRFVQDQEEISGAKPLRESAAPREQSPAGAPLSRKSVASVGEGPAGGATAPRVAMRASGARGAACAVAPSCPETPCCLPAPAVNVARPPCIPYNGPVLSHTRIYRGNDEDVTEALQGYVFARDDQRFGGWKSYLDRSDDFIRFCCHMHISEMLSARGGAAKTRVVWRWPDSR